MFLFADHLSRSFMHPRDQRGGLSWSSDHPWEHPHGMSQLELEVQWEDSPVPSSPSPAPQLAAGSECIADEDSTTKFPLLSGILRPGYGFLSSNPVPASQLLHLPHENQMELLPSSDLHTLMPTPDKLPSTITAISSHAEAAATSDHPSPNFPHGLGAICNDLRYDISPRRHLLGIMGLDHKGLITDFTSNSMQSSDLYRSPEARGQIGLNLGVRTYFSREDNLFGRLKKRGRANSPAAAGGSQPAPMCQAQGCNSDLTIAKHYHRRHKVCELHSKAVQVITNGQNQRFCQQCSRFHPLPEFDEGKRSCRKRLADHNRRRRKPQPSTSNPSKRPDYLFTKVKKEDMDQPLATADRDHLHERNESSEEKQEKIVQWNENSPTPIASLENAENQQLDRLDTIPKVDCHLSIEKITSAHSSLLSNVSNSVESKSDSSQALLSSMSSNSPLSLLLQNHNKGHLSRLACPPEDSVYEHILQGVCGSDLSPNLRLSASRIMSERGCYTQPEFTSLHQTYCNDVETTVPWLKTMDLKSSCIEHRTNRQHPITLDSATTCHELPTSQMLPPFIHNLLPSESSRAVETSDWVATSMSCAKQEHLFRLETSPPSSRLDHQTHFTGGLSNGARSQATRSTPNILNFLQQEPAINSDQSETASTDEELSRLKFPELNVLRSFESIYDMPTSFE